MSKYRRLAMGNCIKAQCSIIMLVKNFLPKMFFRFLGNLFWKKKNLTIFFFKKLKFKIENESINLAFSPFDHDVNVPVLKIKYINDCYFDKL
jgi:hypothetical protein